MVGWDAYNAGTVSYVEWDLLCVANTVIFDLDLDDDLSNFDKCVAYAIKVDDDGEKWRTWKPARYANEMNLSFANVGEMNLSSANVAEMNLNSSGGFRGVGVVLTQIQQWLCL